MSFPENVEERYRTALRIARCGSAMLRAKPLDPQQIAHLMAAGVLRSNGEVDAFDEDGGYDILIEDR